MRNGQLVAHNEHSATGVSDYLCNGLGVGLGMLAPGNDVPLKVQSGQERGSSGSGPLLVCRDHSGNATIPQRLEQRLSPGLTCRAERGIVLRRLRLLPVSDNDDRLLSVSLSGSCGNRRHADREERKQHSTARGLSRAAAAHQVEIFGLNDQAAHSRSRHSQYRWRLPMGMTVVNVGIVGMSMPEPPVPVQVGVGLSRRIIG